MEKADLVCCWQDFQDGTHSRCLEGSSVCWGAGGRALWGRPCRGLLIEQCPFGSPLFEMYPLFGGLKGEPKGQCPFCFFGRCLQQHLLNNYAANLFGSRWIFPASRLPRGMEMPEGSLFMGAVRTSLMSPPEKEPSESQLARFTRRSFHGQVSSVGISVRNHLVPFFCVSEPCCWVMKQGASSPFHVVNYQLTGTRSLQKEINVLVPLHRCHVGNHSVRTHLVPRSEEFAVLKPLTWPNIQVGDMAVSFFGGPPKAKRTSTKLLGFPLGHAHFVSFDDTPPPELSSES